MEHDDQNAYIGNIKGLFKSESRTKTRPTGQILDKSCYHSICNINDSISLKLCQDVYRDNIELEFESRYVRSKTRPLCQISE